MENRAICCQLELIHISDIDQIEANNIVLKPEKKFIELILEGKAEYSCQSKQTSAGTILDETVKAKIRYRGDLPFMYCALKYYVLKLYIDSGYFWVGSIEYPCELSYDLNNIYINLTFKASKPI